MPIAVEVNLMDAVGGLAGGSGTWQLLVRNNGTQVLDTGPVAFTQASLTANLPASPWTHLKVIVAPERYAPAAVEVNVTTSGVYRDDTLAKVREAKADSVKIDLPLLRLRETAGVTPPSDPAVDTSLAGPWLKALKGTAGSVYRELQVNSWLSPHSQMTTVSDSSQKTGPLGNPDASGWERFNFRSRAVTPASSGAALILEYGEVGSNGTGGPRFLVSIWAPVRATGAGQPSWRDMVAFVHPSSAKTWYAPAAYPYRDPYPYSVRDNPNVDPKDPDRIFQSYVNLALKYLVGEWSPYRLDGNESIMVSPIFPNPMPSSPDKDEYAMPFCTPAGMIRLLCEVNLYLHRIRYGFSGANFDRWWGARTITAPWSSPTEVVPPPIRRVAVAAYSASTTQLDQLLAGQALSSGRYPVNLWGAPTAVIDQVTAAWRETWCLDMLTGSTTVPATTFENHLTQWVGARSDRRFLMSGSGTTGHNNPDGLYPNIAKASPVKVTVQSPTEARRHAAFWRGPDDKWVGLFCSNAYLSATTPDAGPTPAFPVAPSDDEAHGFMFRISSGFAWAWTAIGVP